jgi:hypothetical protein
MTQAIIEYRAHVKCACGAQCETDVVQFDCGLEPGALPNGWETGVGGPFCPKCSENNEEARFPLGRSVCDDDAPTATECAVCLGSLEFGWNQRNGDIVCAACSSAPCASGSKR